MFLQIILFVLLILVVDYFRRLHLTHNMRRIPLVSRIPFVGSLLALSAMKPDNFIEMWHLYRERYGKSFCGITFGHIMLVTMDRRIVDTLLSSQEHLHKSKLYGMLGSWLGSGLLLSSGKTWKGMRKIITPTFHFTILEEFVKVFDRQTNVFIRKLKPFVDTEIALDIFQPVGLLTMDIIAETAMGVTINAQMNSKSIFVQSVKAVTEIAAHRFVRPHLAASIAMQIFAPQMYSTQMRGIQIMHEFTEKIIENRRDSLSKCAGDSTPRETFQDDVRIRKRSAFLDVLLQSRMDDGKPLTDKQIRDEVNTFMFEGHDTTTSAISFCLYALSRHPEVQDQLFAEIREHFGDDLEREVTYADLQDLQYLNCVIKESLRLYPPVPAIGRWLKTPLTVASDCIIPAGTNVFIILYEMLRDPNVFDNPHSFIPERHLTNNPRLNTFSNIPFSAGPRNCIGQRFALLEMRTVIAKLLRHYELLPAAEEVELSVTIVLKAKNGAHIGLTKRRYD